ncbi:unnamed protein product [Debaryomyces tyrocola]|nr:unnamed protein product [Debaryomyces tyrocola]
MLTITYGSRPDRRGVKLSFFLKRKKHPPRRGLCLLSEFSLQTTSWGPGTPLTVI